VTITDANGCTAAATATVGEPPELLPMTSTTPDGDGINKIFIPIIKGHSFDEYEFMVVNRWGVLIFETNDPTMGWNGFYKGVMSQTAVYVRKLPVEGGGTAPEASSLIQHWWGAPLADTGPAADLSIPSSTFLTIRCPRRQPGDLPARHRPGSDHVLGNGRANRTFGTRARKESLAFAGQHRLGSKTFYSGNMNRTVPPILVLGLVLGVHVNAHDHGPGDARFHFHENRGQWPAQVLYRATAGGGAVFVERDAFTYLLTSGGARAPPGRAGAEPEPFRAHAFKVRFEGAQARGHEGTHRLPHYVNYFLGSDPAAWAAGVPVFAGVELHGMYPGIGMRIDGHDGLKYDWLVAPGADPSRIVMRYEGQDKLRVEGGLLYVETTAGTVVEQRPVAWQEVDGTRRPVPCRYTLSDDRVGFELKGHDPRYPLVIDPVVIFSSYIGSTGNNFGYTATYDESGHLYGGGTVFAAGYPVTPGVIQSTFAGPAGLLDMGTDMAISKFAPDGRSLIWSTYLGGSANEAPHSMVVNSADELFIMGTTGSTNFPTTPGCYQGTFAGGNAPPFGAGTYGFAYNTGSDIVVVRLNAAATALLGSTYVGGTGNDGLNQTAPVLRHYGDPFRGEIILDQQERPLVATSTMSAGLFTSPGAPQPASGGGQDGYFFRMDPGLTSMLWATYYGGSGIDAGFGIQTSSTGDIYVTGGTTSNNLPMAGVPFRPTFGGNIDGFIARYNPAGNQLLSATYLGTNAVDLSYFVQLDLLDNVFVIGSTTGAYPVTPGCYANAAATQFIHKLTNDLSTSIWSTRVGGNGTEHLSPTAFLVSNCEQIYFSAWGGSTNLILGSNTRNLPITPGAFQATTDGSDFYLMVLNKDAVSLEYATYFGGTSAEHVDGGTSRFDKNGIVYQAVCAGCSGSFPTTPGVVSTVNRSSCNLGVFKIDFEQNLTVDITADATTGTACSGIPFTFTARGNATTWTWDFGDGSPRAQGTPVQHPYPNPGTYRVMLIGIDSTSCGLTDTAYVEVIIVPCVHVVNTIGSATCPGGCTDIRASISNDFYPPYTYTWTGGVPDGPGPHQVCPTATANYTVTVTDANGATSTATVTVVVHPQPTVTASHADVKCAGGSDGTTTATPSSGTPPYTYSWNTTPVQNTPIANGLPIGTYTVTLTDANGCSSSATTTVSEPPPLVTTTATTPANCGASDGTATVTGSGGTPPYTYGWSTMPAQNAAVATGLPAGNYTVTVTDANGCVSTNSATVTTVIAGQLSTAHTDVSCNGGTDGTVSADVTGGNPPFNYAWNTVPPQGTATATGLPVGTYTVTVTDSQGCVSSAQVTIAEPPAIVLSTASTPTNCGMSNGSTTVVATGGTPPFSYAWNSNPGQTTPTANGVPAGPYVVIVTDTKGCTRGANVLVDDIPGPVADFGSNEVCVGGTMLFTNGSSGRSNLTFSWSLGDGTTSTLRDPSHTYASPGAYTVTLVVTDSAGCTATRTRDLTVHPLPVADFSGPLTGCSPVTSTFVNNAPLPGVTCLWEFGDGTSSSDCSGPTHTYTTVGCYDVTLTVTSPAGCSARRTEPSLICVRGTPVADFSIDPGRVPENRPSVNLINRSRGAVRYFWTFSADSTWNSTDVEPTVDVRSLAPGRYNICLLASNDLGCPDRTCRVLTVYTDFLVHVPNAFTPEGDGHNEIFIPILSDYNVDEYEFMVFNRWGELIFQTGNPYLGWNGRYRGVMSQTDVYVWKLRVRSMDAGEAKELIGHVTLLR